MELKAYQAQVNKFVKENNIESSIENRLIDLYAEIGEFSKEILKGNSYGKKNFEITKNIKYELGDVFFSLLCVSNLLNMDIGESLEAVFEKYKKRFEERGDISSGR